LVEWVSRRGIYVKRFTMREMAQLFEVREGLEPIAARLAATRIAPAEVKRFKQMFDGFSTKPSAAEVRRYLKCDRQFHWRLVELTENPHLAAAMESVNMMISAYQVGVPRSLAESLPEHQAILGAESSRPEALSRHAGATAACGAPLQRARAEEAGHDRLPKRLSAVTHRRGPPPAG
jgi:DNA-binding GntR family transcriptional regulator